MNKIDLNEKLADVLYKEHLVLTEKQQELRAKKREVEDLTKYLNSLKNTAKRTEKTFIMSLSPEDRDKLIENYLCSSFDSFGKITWICKTMGVEIASTLRDELNPCSLTVGDITGTVDDVTDLIWSFFKSNLRYDRVSMSFGPWMYISIKKGYGNSHATMDISVDRDDKTMYWGKEEKSKIREGVLKLLRERQRQADIKEKEKGR